MAFEVQEGQWGAEIQPNQAGETLKLGRQKAPEAAAIKLWTGSKTSQLTGNTHTLTHLLVLGRRLARERRFQEARELLELALASDLPLNWRLIMTSDLLEYAAAAGGSKELLVEQEKIVASLARESGKTLLLAQTYRCLGFLAWSLRDLNRASEYWGIALEIDRSLTPGSLGEALDLDNMGAIAQARGDVDLAYSNFTRSLDIRRNLSPGTIQHARSSNNLGVIAWHKGRLDLAENYWREALSLKISLYGEGREAATTLVNLAALSSEKRDFVAAEEFAQRALTIYEKISPAGLETAEVLTTLGIIERGRGNLSGSIAYHARAVTTWEAVAPESSGLAIALNALAVAYHASGDADTAVKILKRAATLYKENSSHSDRPSSALSNMGIILAQSGRTKEALNVFNQVLPHQEQLAPNSLGVAETLFWLGTLAMQQRNYDQAIELLERSLSIQAVYAPRSDLEAMSRHQLGQAHLKKGAIEVGLSYLESALTTITKHFEMAGGSLETRLGYPSSYARLFYDCMEEQLNLNLQDAALLTTERYRAQAFQMLVRNGVPGSGATEGSEVVSMLSENAAAQDAIQRKLEVAERGRDREATEKLLRQRESLLAERSGILVRYRTAFPQHAALAYPQTPALADVLRAGDEGTLVLSYMVTPDSLYTFVLANGRLVNVLRKPVTRQYLEREITPLRQLTRFRMSLGVTNSAKSAKRLFELLIGPVADLASRERRLLIIPDGPLHYLPWGALIREYEDNGSKKQQYLAEWKPFHIVLSASVFAEMKKARRPIEPEGTVVEPLVPNFVAFGDPLYPSAMDEKRSETISDTRVRSTAQRGLLNLESLPWSRREVDGIAALFPPGQTKVFLGAEATEEEAKKISKGTRILHFATHGLVDDRFPMNSALALTIPAGFPKDHENGLLQVWEIFERVRLDAGLVVLSACDTALGEEHGGEGLTGLTRAFQYAGARTVIASLWSVQDQATSELMIRFYKHLRAGRPKDEALRQAQIELIRGPIEVVNEKGEKTLLDASAPYYWAGFQVYGDWQ
ncbi:MAG TPA: CHAT domain-containing tetratricopeptide repeat protein [Thermoanaerobaculia bacterium]